MYIVVVAIFSSLIGIIIILLLLLLYYSNIHTLILYDILSIYILVYFIYII